VAKSASWGSSYQEKSQTSSLAQLGLSLPLKTALARLFIWGQSQSQSQNQSWGWTAGSCVLEVAGWSLTSGLQPAV
jgi:hypothetical protein